MKKLLSLLILSMILVFTGCGNSVPDQEDPVTVDEQDDDSDEVKYQLILDYGFESKKTSYAEGDKVKVYYDIIATDTDYSFYTDSEDVELSRDYDDKKGYVITFIMPAHDVALHVDSVNSMEYRPYEYNDVPGDALDALHEYANENSELTGIMPVNICMFDVTDDGEDDVCATFYTGSETFDSIVVVYDLKEMKGYTLEGSGYYDFTIDGIEDGLLLVTEYDQNTGEEITGTVGTVYDLLVFMNYNEMLKTGLSYKALFMFGSCARYLLPGDTSSGDYLSSMDFLCVKNMLYDLSGIFYDTELAQEEDGYGPEVGNGHITVERIIMPYDDWAYLVEEVFMEEDAGNLLDNLDESFSGEISVFYVPDDDCIYLEQGLMGDMVTWHPTEVYKEGTRYIVTYDILDIDYNRLWTAEVTIEEADNTYGYSLIGLEITYEAEDVFWARP